MELYSRSRDFKEFKITGYDKLFLDLPGRLRRIWAVSAYYDPASIKQLIKLLKNKGDQRTTNELIIILDRGAAEIDELQALDQKIGKICSEASGIYLATSKGGIFHSKGYMAETASRGQVLIGSMNLTQRGIKGNEEILLDYSYKIEDSEHSTDVASQYKDYVQYLLKSAHRVRDLEPQDQREIYDLRSFFLDGHIFYETKEQDPFRLKLDLPEQALIAESPLSEYLDSNTSDSLNVARLVSAPQYGLGISLPTTKNIQARWKSYCLQTCYGYWCSDEYLVWVKEEIRDVRLNGFHPWMEVSPI